MTPPGTSSTSRSRIRSISSNRCWTGRRVRRIAAAAVLLLAAACAVRSARLPDAVNQIDRLVPTRAARAIDALLVSFDRKEAMGHVEFMSPLWRLAGNDGFDMSIDRLEARLL